MGRGEKMDSRLRRSVLRTALRASVGAARLGVNLRPLPPEYNATPDCNQGLTEYHELKHSHKMFFDHVISRWITFALWQKCDTQIVVQRSITLSKKQALPA
jgi:hypothetical protein